LISLCALRISADCPYPLLLFLSAFPRRQNKCLILARGLTASSHPRPYVQNK
jgi:hypothetical protein